MPKKAVLMTNEQFQSLETVARARLSGYTYASMDPEVLQRLDWVLMNVLAAQGHHERERP